MKMFILMISSVMAISSSSWVMIWVMMELNTLMMCMVLSEEFYKEKKSQSPAFIYYLTQCLASVMMMCFIMMDSTSTNKIMFIMLMFLVKMGAWPFHTWYMKVISSLEMGKSPMMLLMSWQKIIPIYFISTICSEVNIYMLLIMSIFSMVIPTLLLKGENSMKTIMGLSSLHNNGWLILSSISSWCMAFFFTIYSVSLVLSLKVLEIMEMKNTMNNSKMWFFTMALSNMGGLPPLMMFTSKIVLMKSILWSMMPEICIFMMMTSCVFLYHYFWAMSSGLYFSPEKTQNMMKEESLVVMMAVPIMSVTVLISMVMFLGSTKKGFILMG